MLIGNIGVHLLNASISAVAEMTGGALIAAYVLGFLAVLAWVWCLVGLWASSTQHLATRNTKVWGWLARVLVVTFVIGTILNLGQQFGAGPG
jgi:peptidoglycan biosynthesis protein MviN/MurJ (putative lipid II flippase)